MAHLLAMETWECNSGALYAGDPAENQTARPENRLAPAVSGRWCTKVRVADDRPDRIVVWALDASVEFDAEGNLLGELEDVCGIDSVYMIGVFDSGRYPDGGEALRMCRAVCSREVERQPCGTAGRLVAPRGGLLRNGETPWGVVQASCEGMWDIAVQRDSAGVICAVCIDLVAAAPDVLL